MPDVAVDNKDGSLETFKETLETAFCDLIKFCYGFLFGSIMWSIIVKPYGRYYDFEFGSYWPEFIFCLLTAFTYMTFQQIRCVLVLFLPNLIGNATQNYIIVLLFVSLFANPVTNIGLNAIESIRVIGCSLTMTFESMREQAKLVLNPVLEVFEDQAQRQGDDLEPVRSDLRKIDQLMGAMRQPLRFNKIDFGTRQRQRVYHDSNNNRPQNTKIQPVLGKQQQQQQQQPGLAAGRAEQEQEQREIDNNTNKSRQSSSLLSNTNTNNNHNKDNIVLNRDKLNHLLQQTNIELDPSNFGVKATLDVDDELTQLVGGLRDGSSRLGSGSGKASESSLNLTEVIYASCLEILRGGKRECQTAMAELRQDYKRRFGPYFAEIWFAPIFLTIGSVCPWLLDRLVDEATLCQPLRNSSGLLQLDVRLGESAPIKDLDGLFANMSRQIDELSSDFEAAKRRQQQQVSGASGRPPPPPPRLELRVAFNERTRQIFLSVRNLIDFIRDKYRMRQLLVNILRLAYDLYTTYTFLLILHQAHRYRRRYLYGELAYDNHYVTGEFRRLDAAAGRGKPRGADGGARRLLPLTSDESRRYISTFTCRRRTHEERHYQRASCAMIVLFLLFTLSLIYLDDIFYSLLDYVRQHSLIQYQQVGHHELDIRVLGEGAIARRLRGLAARLSSVYDLNRRSSTQVCLPQASRSRRSFYVEFLGYALAYFVIDQLSIYAMRLRRLTCAFFYPSRERARIKYLHAIISRRRKLMSSYVGYMAEAGAEGEHEGSRDPDLTFDEDVFTIKHALAYLGNCARISLGSCRA